VPSIPVPEARTAVQDVSDAETCIARARIEPGTGVGVGVAPGVGVGVGKFGSGVAVGNITEHSPQSAEQLQGSSLVSQIPLGQLPGAGVDVGAPSPGPQQPYSHCSVFVVHVPGSRPLLQVVILGCAAQSGGALQAKRYDPVDAHVFAVSQPPQKALHGPTPVK